MPAPLATVADLDQPFWAQGHAMFALGGIAPWAAKRSTSAW
jgi:hypothetical protein